MSLHRPTSPEERERRALVRAGLFVSIGLVLAGAVVFVIGNERDLFSEALTYTGAFENVDGLQLDSPVRLGGLQVGRVRSISFASDLGDSRIVVSMEIGKKFQERIRRDSIARVTSRGVLGDKAIDISLGSQREPMLQAGAEIPTGSSGDLSAVLKATGEMVDNAVAITRDLRTGVGAYTSEATRADVSAIISSVRRLMTDVEQGRGLLHALVYDRTLVAEVRELLRQLNGGARRLDDAIGRVDAVVAEVQSGSGSLHALIYDPKVAASLTEVGTAAHELATLVHDARASKDSALAQLISGDARALVSDLTRAAADVRAVTAKVRAGEGTLGGLVADPTVYEDLKTLLGNIKRNALLRELVRMSISNAESDGAAKPKR